ncbi:Fur family transcriptional regulator [Leucobacter sp. GX24907]
MHERRTASPASRGERLRAHGLRVTSGRVATLGYLEEHPHSSAAEIHTALADELPSLSTQSVHNIVHDLTSCGILRRIDLPGTSSALYETRIGDNHHHVQCIVCHRIEDVPCAVGSAPCLTPGDTHGMRIVEAAVTFSGICSDCDAAQTAESHAPIQQAS